MSDGYAYNVQWQGTRPVFIDVGSFQPSEGGGPWAGYRQFCQTFLFPLMLQGHRGVAFRPLLRGQVDGITPAQAAPPVLAGRLGAARGVPPRGPPRPGRAPLLDRLHPAGEGAAAGRPGSTRSS